MMTVGPWRIEWFSFSTFQKEQQGKEGAPCSIPFVLAPYMIAYLPQLQEEACVSVCVD